jgi:hypothetical protein
MSASLSWIPLSGMARQVAPRRRARLGAASRVRRMSACQRVPATTARRRMRRCVALEVLLDARRPLYLSTGAARARAAAFAMTLTRAVVAASGTVVK